VLATQFTEPTRCRSAARRCGSFSNQSQLHWLAEESAELDSIHSDCRIQVLLYKTVVFVKERRAA